MTIEILQTFWNDRTALREFVKANPVLGALLFIFLQALQVIIAPLPGEVTGFLAGFIFGAPLGFLLSMIGILLGSVFTFLVIRGLRDRYFRKYNQNQHYRKLKKYFRRFGLFGVFFLYLFPGFPKDLLNYLVALMPISLRAFLIVCTLGRAPGTLALAIQGDVVYEGHPYRIVIVSTAFLIAFLIFLFLRKRLEAYLNNTT